MADNFRKFSEFNTYTSTTDISIVGYYMGQNVQMVLGTVDGNEEVKLGYSAGATNQGSFATALGSEAGQENQGAFSIAMGYRAGQTNQSPRSIVINATGGVLNGGAEGSVSLSTHLCYMLYTPANGWTFSHTVSVPTATADSHATNKAYVAVEIGKQVHLEDDQSINGIKQFQDTPTCGNTPVNNDDLVNREYAHSLITNHQEYASLLGLTPDLNVFTGTGYFRSPSAAEPVFNNPVGLDGAFTLKVESIQNDADYIRQTYSDYKSISEWIRVYRLETGVWTPWVQVITDVEAVLARLSALETRISVLETP